MILYICALVVYMVKRSRQDVFRIKCSVHISDAHVPKRAVSPAIWEKLRSDRFGFPVGRNTV